jgi:hypothetical protein
MPKRLISLRIEHIAGVDKPANKRKFLIVKSEKESEDKGAVVMLTKEQIAKIGDKDAMEAVIKQQEEMLDLEKKVKAQDEEIAKLKNAPSPDKDDDETIWKGIPPTVRNRFEAIKRERDDMQKAAKDEKDKSATAQWTTKCREFKYVQVTPEHFGKIMKKVAENSPDEADEIMRVVGAADELIGKGHLFSEFGKSGSRGGGPADATNVVARVMALADDYMEMEKGLKQDAAIQKVFREHPEWYQPYVIEARIGTGTSNS